MGGLEDNIEENFQETEQRSKKTKYFLSQRISQSSATKQLEFKKESTQRKQREFNKIFQN